MGYAKKFENDIFISYAHIDNQALTEEQKGWIDDFHRALEVRLEQLLGGDATIWRDAKLQGNDIFSDTLIDRLPKVAVLVSVLSPRYVKSEWCLRELNTFLKIAEERHSLLIGNKARVFKVVKTPVPLEQHPPELQGMLGYEFFKIDKATGKPMEFWQEFGADAVKNFWARLDDLAWDIHQLLEEINKNGNGAAPQVSSPAGEPVYLAQTTFDLEEERNKVKRELQHRGYEVLPDKPLSLDAEQMREEVRGYLARCKLSVHLIGENYGVIPEGATESISYLQNQLASECSDDSSFIRLIWMPAKLDVKDQRQQHFIDYLQNNSEAQKGADVLQVSLEDLKTVIHDKMSHQPTESKQPAESGPARVYLICDQVDYEATNELEGYLFDEGLEVLLPTFDADETQTREDHIDNLKLCDAILIYYGQATDRWVRSKVRDLMKAAGYGRTRPFRAKAVLLAGEMTPQKKRFRTNEATLLTTNGNFTPAALSAFLQELHSG